MVATRPGDVCPLCGSARLIHHAEIEALEIAHVDCDAFYAAVEKRDRPELAEQPLIVGHAGGRGVVTTACYLARRFGVRSAMPMFKAMELCPQAIVVPPDMARYRAVSNDIRAIMREATEVIEPVSLDEAYLDLGHEHLRGEASAPEALALVARRVEREVGITVSVGLSYNKLLAKLASDREKPRGYSIIGRAEALDFLAALPVAGIHGVGAATARRLEAAGLATVADLQRAPEAELTTLLGRFGRRLAEFARGMDGRAVTPSRPTKSISVETTFDRDVVGAAALIEAAGSLAERLGGVAARKRLAGTTVVLKFKTSEFRLVTRHRRLAQPTVKVDVLMKTAAQVINAVAGRERWRLLGIGLEGLVPLDEADLPDLFATATNRIDDLDA